jgi:hypothetical protein
MLLRRDACRAGRLLAEAQEFPHLIAESRQSFDGLEFRNALFRSSVDRLAHGPHYITIRYIVGGAGQFPHLRAASTALVY